LDISLFSIVASLLRSFVPLLIGIWCFVVWFRVLPRPGHFLVISVLAMFGLSELFHRILRFVLTVGVFVSPSSFGGGEGSQDIHDVYRVEMWQAFAVAALTVFIGFFLLRASMRLQASRQPG
jgi:hypothetical protein